MIPLMWISAAYGFCRMLTAGTLAQAIAYGLLFCLAGAFIAFADELESD